MAAECRGLSRILCKLFSAANLIGSWPPPLAAGAESLSGQFADRLPPFCSRHNLPDLVACHLVRLNTWL